WNATRSLLVTIMVPPAGEVTTDHSPPSDHAAAAVGAVDVAHARPGRVGRSGAGIAGIVLGAGVAARRLRSGWPTLGHQHRDGLVAAGHLHRVGGGRLSLGAGGAVEGGRRVLH